MNLQLVEQPGAQAPAERRSRLPPTRTFFSPAASRACSTALSTPSVTKVNVVPSRLQRLASVVRDNEHGRVERRLVSPPAVRVRVIFPRDLLHR